MMTQNAHGKVPVRLEWDKAVSFWTNFDEWISGKLPTTMQNPNAIVFFSDGTSRRVKAEDVPEILAA